jgi:hypothetical protein
MTTLSLPSFMAAGVTLVASYCINVDTQDTVTKCFVRATTASWETASMDVDVSSPDRCPFAIPTGRVAEQSFVGIVTGNPSFVGAAGYVGLNEYSTSFVRVFNTFDPPTLVNKDRVVPKNIFSGNPPRSEARVTYSAGTGPTNIYGTGGKDYGYLDVSLRDQSLAQGRSDLTFTYTVLASISGPSSVLGGSTINLGTSLSNYRAPVTYKWWRDGSLMSGVTWSNFSTTGPTAGFTTTYKVEVTDADGDKGTNTRSVTGTSPPVSGGGSGGGCQSQPMIAASPSIAGATAEAPTGVTAVPPNVANALPCP